MLKELIFEKNVKRKDLKSALSALNYSDKEIIAGLNDFIRTNIAGDHTHSGVLRRAIPHRVSMTHGVVANFDLDDSPQSYLQNPKYYELLECIAKFNEFTEGNDPYGEHDFEKVVFDGKEYHFKIDYCTSKKGRHISEYLSEDPSDPNKTYRVMIIRKASEY